MSVDPKENDIVEFNTSEKVKILIERDGKLNMQQYSRLLGYAKQTLSNKLDNNSLKTSDMEQIMDILGYEVVFRKKPKRSEEESL